MNQSGQLKALDTTFLAHYDSKRRLLELISDLQDQLNDAITINQLKNLCAAIANEIDTLNDTEAS